MNRISLLSLAALAGLGLLPARALALTKVAEKQIEVYVAVDQSIVIEAYDDQISFANLTPSQTGWVEAADMFGDADTCIVMVGANTPARITYYTGGNLTEPMSGDDLTTQFSPATQGRGDLDGVPFTAIGTWSAWDTWRATGVSGQANYEPGRFGIQFKAQALRDGLNDPPGIYIQSDPMTLVLTAP